MFEVTMPKAGQTVEEGVIVSWFKAEGQSVEKGEVLAEIETDKAVFELESPASGVLLKRLYPEGASVPVFGLLAIIGESGENADDYIARRPAPSPSPEQEAPSRGVAAVPEPTRTAAAPSSPASEIKCSPAARKAAKDLGVDISRVATGSGPGGLVTAADVELFAQSQATALAKPPAEAAPGITRRPLTKMRKAIAANLTFSKQTIPHFYLKTTVNAEAAEKFCRSMDEGRLCGINDLILLACGRVMREFPELRCRMEGDEVVEFASANIGIAVAVKDGLVVPVIEGVDAMTVETLAQAARSAVSNARAGKVSGAGRGTFTVTNLGMFGVEEFAAIINPPESAILAVGAIRDAVVAAGGQVSAGRVMTLMLSLDHRLIDGVTAARFMAKLKDLIESPQSLSKPPSPGASR